MESKTIFLYMCRGNRIHILNCRKPATKGGSTSILKFYYTRFLGPIREQRQKRHYSSSICVKSRTSTVVESKTRLRSKGNFVLDSTTFLNFRVPDSTTSSKIACLCIVMNIRENNKNEMRFTNHRNKSLRECQWSEAFTTQKVY